MQPYNRQLKSTSRTLRGNMTDAEQHLWHHLRRKQLHGVQFYRQKPIRSFTVDFYCPSARLVVELDGSQHLADEHRQADKKRDQQLMQLGLTVLRFDNRQVFLQTPAVLEVISATILQRL